MKGKGILIGSVVLGLLAGCSTRGGKPQETPTNGTINISVDESFKPVIDSQIKVFESSYPDVHIVAHYKSEAECFRDLTTDSTRMVIVTRSLSKDEEKFYVDSFHLTPTEGPLAYDAIAVLVHPGVKDSIFDMKEIQDMLSGKDVQHQPVMDGLSATSTVRFAMDSILRGQPLGKNVKAAESSMAVVDYVANNPRAVGFIGVSWVGDRNDPADTTFSKKVNVAAVECTSCLGKTYVRPFQANIAWKRYPMVRSLYYILKENYSGVGNNFANFLQYERGQLIFKRAYLWPARMTAEQQSVEMSK